MAKTKLGSLGLTADIVNGTMTATDLTGGEGTATYQLTTDGVAGTGGGLSWALAGSAAGSLAGLSDTTFSSGATGQIIVHNGTAWINVVPPSGGDVTIVASGEMTIGANKVVSSMIATDTIVAGNIAASAVGLSELADGGVTPAKMALSSRNQLASTYTASVSGGGTGSTAITVTIDGTIPGGTLNDVGFSADAKLLLRISDTAASIKPNTSAIATFSGAQVVDGDGTCTAWVQGHNTNANVVCVVDGPAGADTFYLHVIGMEGAGLHGISATKGFAPKLLTFTA
jgi:hypothetical protein